LEEKKILFQLSKSTFIRGKQCIKSLYLNKFHKNLRDKISEQKKAVFKSGTNIGIFARQLFPNGIDATPPSPFDYSAALKTTENALLENDTVVYEASFVFNEVLIAVDILTKNKNNIAAYEVKSATKISDTYIWDAALQYYVLKGCGIFLSDFFIVTINNAYIKNGQLEVEKLFTKTSIFTEVNALQEKVEEYILQFKKILSEAEIPNVKIGGHCTSPYDCDFLGFCWKDVPSGSVFELSNTNNSTMAELYYSGIKLISEIPNNFELSASQKIQISAEKNKTDIINKEALIYFLNQLVYPLHFLDFETFMPALPLYNNTHPFHHLPFQFSLHLLENKTTQLKHLEFVAFPGSDPRKEFINELLKKIKQEGSIIVYNAQFERSILNTLAKEFPEYQTKISNITDRIIDLMEPFRKRDCYFLAMKGSHSIKNVLPAVFTDFHYEHLAISNGNEASRMYEQLIGETNIFKIEETISNLKEYCKLDTLAMVKILERLNEIKK
jgi:hypothetical protein